MSSLFKRLLVVVAVGSMSVIACSSNSTKYMCAPVAQAFDTCRGGGDRSNEFFPVGCLTESSTASCVCQSKSTDGGAPIKPDWFCYV